MSNAPNERLESEELEQRDMKKRSGNKSQASPPRLSVVVVILGGRSYLHRWLERFTGYEGKKDVEVLVPCDDCVSDLPSLQREFPSVRFLHAPGQHSYAQLRSLGVRQSRGAVVAITEDHCTPDPNWCARILAEHQSRHAAIGGAIEKEEPDTILNWAIYLSDFSRYMNPVPEGPSHYLTDCNVSYKRTALESIADLWATEFHETSVNWTLESRGESLWLSSSIPVLQQRSLRLGTALRERYAFGRLFAGTRVAHTTVVKRTMYAILSWMLPALLVARVAKNVFDKRRHVGAFLRALPAIVLMAVIWSLGEFIGYITARPATEEPAAEVSAQSGRRATA